MDKRNSLLVVPVGSLSTVLGSLPRHLFAFDAIKSGKKPAERYIDDLTIDELKYLVGKFWTWYSEDGCPFSQDSNFPCGREDELDSVTGCDGEADGCWVRYYLWLLTNQKTSHPAQTDTGVDRAAPQ